MLFIAKAIERNFLVHIMNHSTDSGHEKTLDTAPVFGLNPFLETHFRL